MAFFLRRLGQMGRAAPVLSHGCRPFSSLGKSKEKIKEYAKKIWGALDQRAQGAVYDTVGRSVVVVLSGGTGWVIYLRPLFDRQERFKEHQRKVNHETEKSIDELWAQAARTEEHVSQSREEHTEKHKSLENELKDLNFLKELWLSTAFIEGCNKRAEESKRP